MTEERQNLVRIEWREKQGRFESGKSAIVSGTVLGSYYWNCNTPQHREQPWKIQISLPSCMVLIERHATEESAMKEIEILIQKWFGRMLRNSLKDKE